MRPACAFTSALVVLTACINDGQDARSPVATGLAVTTSSLAVIGIVGMDTLSDSASIHHLQPEPDGGSVAFLFRDPGKAITRALGLVSVSGTPVAQLAWPDSVNALWWSGPHQLSFTAGTGKGVRVVVDAHAAQLEALQVSDSRQSISPATGPRIERSAAGLARAQAFIDSLRVQPGGMPQESALRYRADSILIAPGDTFAAVHVSARNNQGVTANPAWYVTHLPSGHTHAVDSLTGTSSGLPASAGQWGADGRFYYAKERSIWRAEPRTH